jgi:hypothetical protein
MMVVRIEKPENTMLAVWFAELRSWFDENHCEPTIFSESGKKIDKLLFNVTFSDNTHALFRQRFTRRIRQIVLEFDQLPEQGYPSRLSTGGPRSQASASCRCRKNGSYGRPG